ERPDENEGGARVVRGATAAAEPFDGGGEGDRRPERAERSREAETRSEHEAGKGRGRNPVRVEREPAQDDPRAENAGGQREAGELERAALHEGVVEWAEHALTIMIPIANCATIGGGEELERRGGARPRGERPERRSAPGGRRAPRPPGLLPDRATDLRRAPR